MDLISVSYALLLIVSIFIYYIISFEYRILLLTLLSCCLIAGISWLLLVYIVCYTVINFFIGKYIPFTKNKKALFRTGLIFNLSQLVILKYSSFALDPIFQIFGSNYQISGISDIIIPLGVSFFTLQGIGYLINIKMGWEKPEKNFLHFLLYILYYPKFLSGPIERSNHFLPQLIEVKSFNEKQVVAGLRLALLGFFKKVVIANQLGIIVNDTYYNIDTYSGLNLWMVILIQPLYLYFDFSGYTDIALGFSKALGINLLPNFNKPFLSENVTTFWRRMHMSLSSWFNDYVFKQVSFKYRRWGKYASAFAVFVTFTLFGIWHGAGWNFMILGFLQALAINYEFFTKKKRVVIFSRIPDYCRIWFGRLATYLFFGISLIFFFSPDFRTSTIFYSKLFVWGDALNLAISTKLLLSTILCLTVVLILEFLENDYDLIYNKIVDFWCHHKSLRVIVYYLTIFSVLYLIGHEQVFIYSRF